MRPFRQFAAGMAASVRVECKPLLAPDGSLGASIDTGAAE